MPSEFLTLQEIVKRARGQLARGEWDYLIGGAESETTLKRNRLAFERLALKARVMNDVSSVRVSRELLGVEQRIPVLLAPIGSLQVFEAGGGLSAAQAAGEFGNFHVLSSVCMPDFETVARESQAAKIYQYYAHEDEAALMSVAGRAEAAGYKAFCLTVDTQVYSRRERDIVKRYSPAVARRSGFGPGQPRPATMQARLSWELVDRFKARFRIPLALKGIACGEDAELAVRHGVDIIWVSNHGGRQLDQGRGTLDCLPEVVRAVGGRATVLIDGGIMRGTDVLKALALGADAVAIGRLQGLALAAGGAPALVRMLELLEFEMSANLALMGLSSIDQLTPACVIPAEPVVAPSVLSSFPLLDEDY